MALYYVDKKNINVCSVLFYILLLFFFALLNVLEGTANGLGSRWKALLIYVDFFAFSQQWTSGSTNSRFRFSFACILKKKANKNDLTIQLLFASLGPDQNNNNEKVYKIHWLEKSKFLHNM